MRWYRLFRAASRLSQRRCLCTATEAKKSDLMKHLTARIKASGPLSVAEYMKEVLTNPLSGYYMHSDVFGQSGDFTTSPEISQMFGELMGIWCINEWVRCGTPQAIQLVELGPGRGTLADDMLRTFSQFPAFNKVVSLHMVEVSPKMTQLQEEKLTGEAATEVSDYYAEASPPYKTVKSKYGPMVHWYKDLREVPNGFSCYIAHEFFDALPIYKFHKTDRGWCEVLVDLNDGQSSEDQVSVGNPDADFKFVLSGGSTYPVVTFLRHLQPDEPRNHIEVCPVGGVVIEELANRIDQDGGFSLICDYGHDGDKTDTFRGFKNHKQHDVLKDPGTADLTADVDFSYLKHMAEPTVQTFGPVTQSHFLHNMGIVTRLQILAQKSQDEETKKKLVSEYDMLVNPEKMGERFKFFAMFKKNSKNYTPAGFIDPKLSYPYTSVPSPDQKKD